MKMKIILLVAIVLILAVIFTVITHQRQGDDILMELVYWSGTRGERGSPIYYFVVKNDGTFISYHGLSRSNSSHPRTRNFIRSVREREQITLDDEDFLYITELVNRIVSGTYEKTVSANSIITFLHNGKIYENSTGWTDPLADLISTLIELTPLTVHNLD